MAVTIAKEQLHKIPTAGGSGLILGVYLVTFGNVYPTGGEEVDLSGYMKQVLDMKVQATEDSPGYVFDVDDSNFATAKPKIEAYWSAAVAAHLHNLLFKNADVADAANNRVNVDTDKIGANTGADITVASTQGTRGVQNAGAIAAGALAEVTNGTDLSAVKARCVAWGIG